jgi:hypothetical protein
MLALCRRPAHRAAGAAGRGTERGVCAAACVLVIGGGRPTVPQTCQGDTLTITMFDYCVMLAIYTPRGHGTSGSELEEIVGAECSHHKTRRRVFTLQNEFNEGR